MLYICAGIWMDIYIRTGTFILSLSCVARCICMCVQDVSKKNRPVARRMIVCVTRINLPARVPARLWVPLDTRACFIFIITNFILSIKSGMIYLHVCVEEKSTGCPRNDCIEKIKAEPNLGAIWPQAMALSVLFVGHKK